MHTLHIGHIYALPTLLMRCGKTFSISISYVISHVLYHSRDIQHNIVRQVYVPTTTWQQSRCFGMQLTSLNMIFRMSRVLSVQCSMWLPCWAMGIARTGCCRPLHVGSSLCGSSLIYVVTSAVPFKHDVHAACIFQSEGKKQDKRA